MRCPNVIRISNSASYEKLNSGSVAESLVELSGGVSQKILLTEDKSKAAAKDGSLWARIARCVALMCLRVGHVHCSLRMAVSIASFLFISPKSWARLLLYIHTRTMFASLSA